MRKLSLPGFSESELSSRLVFSGEELREYFCVEGCDAQVFFLSYEPRHAATAHTHEELRVTVVRSGRMRFDLGGQRQELSAGDVIVIRPEVPHGFEGCGDDRINIAEFVFTRGDDAAK